ncbi:MAG: hypothetical protein WCC45_11210 [Paeniglutamicibacter sp.]
MIAALSGRRRRGSGAVDRHALGVAQVAEHVPGEIRVVPLTVGLREPPGAQDLDRVDSRHEEEQHADDGGEELRPRNAFAHDRDGAAAQDSMRRHMGEARKIRMSLFGRIGLPHG